MVIMTPGEVFHITVVVIDFQCVSLVLNKK